MGKPSLATVIRFKGISEQLLIRQLFLIWVRINMLHKNLGDLLWGGLWRQAMGLATKQRNPQGKIFNSLHSFTVARILNEGRPETSLCSGSIPIYVTREKNQTESWVASARCQIFFAYRSQGSSIYVVGCRRK